MQAWCTCVHVGAVQVTQHGERSFAPLSGVPCDKGKITELVTDASTSIIAMMGKPCMYIYMFVIILLPEVPVFH